MTTEEKEFVFAEVKTSIMPEIRASLPSFIGWILRAVFPRLEIRLVILIERIVELILLNRKHD